MIGFLEQVLFSTLVSKAQEKLICCRHGLFSGEKAVTGKCMQVTHTESHPVSLKRLLPQCLQAMSCQMV